MDLNDKIVIYRTADGQTTVDVRMDGDTVWLSQAQMAELFQKDRTVIGRHINNIFKEGELDESLVCANFAHTKDYGRREGFTQTKNIVFYNLDVIISVGYRVKSQRGTQFRIWANKVLKEYLVKGYVINKALTEQRYTELKQLVAVLGRAVKAQEALTSDDALNLVEVVSDYAYALDTLDKYDYQQLAVEQTTNEAKFRATYEGAMQAIEELKAKFGGSQWFAHEKDDSFKSSIGERRFVQKLHRSDLSDLRRTRPLSFRGGESSHVALFGHEESLVQRWQQAHCCHALLVVHGWEWHPLQSGRNEAHSRKHTCCRRKPHGGEGRDGEGSGEPDK